MDEELIKVGRYNQEYNELLGLNLDKHDIYYSPGIEIHMRKRHHIDCIPYISRLNEIIDSPDYVGKSPKEPDSIELVKKFDKHVMVGIKIDTSRSYMYVSTMYCIQDSKVSNRVNGGRLKKLKSDD